MTWKKEIEQIEARRSEALKMGGAEAVEKQHERGRLTIRERVDALSPNELVRRGVIQVMEGRHCFEHLTVDENLLTGAYTRRDGRAAIAESVEKVYHYFPRLKDRRSSQAGYTSGGASAVAWA